MKTTKPSKVQSKRKGMLYDVLVMRRSGGIVAEEQVYGFSAAEEIQQYYAQWHGAYVVSIEPNVYAYMRLHTDYKLAN